MSQTPALQYSPELRNTGYDRNPTRRLARFNTQHLLQPLLISEIAVIPSVQLSRMKRISERERVGWRRRGLKLG